MNQFLISARLIKHSYYNISFENSKTDIQLYYQDIKQTRFIVFPGTFSATDWLRNLWVIPYQDENYEGDVRLHQGYYSGYRSVRDRFLELANTKLTLVVAGHSSGGCLAQIAGVDANYNLGKKIIVHTFGSPACGNQMWVESANSRINVFSFINFGDMVPYLLFWNKHVTNLIGNQLIFRRPHYIGNYVKSIRSLVSVFFGMMLLMLMDETVAVTATMAKTISSSTRVNPDCVLLLGQVRILTFTTLHTIAAQGRNLK